MRLALLLFIFCFNLWAEETETKIKGLHKEQLAYSVIDLSSGNVVYAHQADKKMILASVTKILTYFYALNILGPDYRFKTSLYYSGKISDGVLEGNLYLQGTGDPYLNTQNILSLVHALKRAGIKSVKGKFVVDGSALLAIESVSTLGLSDQPDNPALSGLNVEFNRVDVWSREGLLYPPVGHVKIVKKRKSQWGQRFEFQELKKNREIWVQHTKEYIPPVDAIPVKHSSLFTGSFFRLMAERFEIELPPSQEGLLEKGAKLIYTHSGLPFERVAELGIDYSNNLMAEASLQASAKKVNSLPQNSKFSAHTMLKWYKKKFPNLSWKNLELVNGSGLTIHNQTTTDFFAKLLKEISQEAIAGRSFWSYLSVNGHSGGIRRRLIHPSLAYRLYGKTGSLYFVNNLAGYLVGKTGKQYAYAFFTTHHANRKILSENDPKQKKYLRRKSSDWNRLSTEAMDFKLEEWINKL